MSIETNISFNMKTDSVLEKEQKVSPVGSPGPPILQMMKNQAKPQQIGWFKPMLETIRFKMMNLFMLKTKNSLHGTQCV